MNKIYSVVALIFASVGLVSCANLTVSKNVNGKFEELPGVPFYTKVPMFTKETKVYATYLLVQLEVTSTIANIKSVTKYPESDPVVIQNKGSNFEDAKKKIQEVLDKQEKDHPNIVETEQQINQLIKDLKTLGGLVPIGDDTEDTLKLLSNTWGVTMEVGQQQHYIAGRMPLIGSADVQFELNDNGTLTKAHSNVVDDTAKTVFSFFPISENFSKHWKLGEYNNPKTPADAKSAVQSQSVLIRAQEMRGQIPLASIPESKKSEISKALSGVEKLARAILKPISAEDLERMGIGPDAIGSADATVSIKEMNRVYSLKTSTMLEETVKSKAQNTTPLKLCACKTGACQIVAVEEITKDSEKKGNDKGDVKGYRIQATILPPESSEKPADGGDKKK